jgi:hypothetical protein
MLSRPLCSVSNNLEQWISDMSKDTRLKSLPTNRCQHFQPNSTTRLMPLLPLSKSTPNTGMTSFSPSPGHRPIFMRMRFFLSRFRMEPTTTCCHDGLSLGACLFHRLTASISALSNPVSESLYYDNDVAFYDENAQTEYPMEETLELIYDMESPTFATTVPVSPLAELFAPHSLVMMSPPVVRPSVPTCLHGQPVPTPRVCYPKNSIPGAHEPAPPISICCADSILPSAAHWIDPLMPIPAWTPNADPPG